MVHLELIFIIVSYTESRVEVYLLLPLDSKCVYMEMGITHASGTTSMIQSMAVISGNISCSHQNKWDRKCFHWTGLYLLLKNFRECVILCHSFQESIPWLSMT